MTRLKTWQWLVLSIPIALPVTFLLIASGWQIHQWGISWIWGIFILFFAGWRWLLVKWTKPVRSQLESIVEEITADNINRDNNIVSSTPEEVNQKIEIALQKILEESQNDGIIWENWQKFLDRSVELIVAVAGAYHPEVKRPLLNIYVPQAYGLIRGTVDDMDRWMKKLSPVLSQVTIGQTYEAIEVYQKLEPSAKKLIQVWNWAQWVLNPVAAIAKTASKESNTQANRQLLANLNGLFREAALRNLCRQAIILYSGNTLPPQFVLDTPTIPEQKTQALREIIESSEPLEELETEPIKILLVGRTGAGKSSVINTIFEADLAEVDVLPSTDKIQEYKWSIEGQENLILWDTPGYEQVDREDFKELVLDYSQEADLLILVTPALDPALEMDLKFLEEIENSFGIVIVTQVDRLRPIREWNPPYDWENGDKPKEKSIRDAILYRIEAFGEICDRVLPLVTRDSKNNRQPWGIENLSMVLLESIEPAKQYRLARILRDRESRIIAAAKIIDNYTRQVSTTQGITKLLKSPILQFLSATATGNPALAYALAEQVPLEQAPVVIGKLQMGYDLYFLLVKDAKINNFDFLSFWKILLQNDSTPDKNASAFGQSLVEYFTKNLTISELQDRFNYYLEQ